MIRGRDVSRIEGFSDAVFGFSLTLLVVSLEVPESFADLQAIAAGFPAFAVTFAVICWVWYEHYLLFRHYAMEDGITVVLNSALLFLVVFYAYPLKFIFTRLVGGTILGLGPGIGEGLTLADSRLLMVLYSGGFVALFTVFLLLHLNAVRQRRTLGLGRLAIYDAQSSAGRHAISVAVGALSIAIALLAPGGSIAYAGLVFFLMGPAHAIYGFINARRRERLEAALWTPSGTSAPAPPSAGASSDSPPTPRPAGDA